MEKEHFEILLEKMEDNFQLAFEKFDLVDNRLDRLETGQAEFADGQTRLVAGQVRLEAGQKSIKVDVRDIKRSMGLLHSIANDHESRLQGVEISLRDHLDDHS